MTRTKKTRPSGNRIPVEDTSTILESISDGVFTINEDRKITSFNRAAEEITGVPRKEAIGMNCSEVFRASMCETDCALARTMKTGRPIVNRSAFIINSKGMRIPVSVSTAIIRDANGRIVGGAETFRDLSVVEELRRELKSRFHLDQMVSRSDAMRKLFAILPQIADSDSTVLIRGETGTGKELLARAVHNLSRRRGKPFVAVNCGALPDTLLESELFGYKAGAFTDARKDKPGRFALAQGGTIFLDEIGDISGALQVRLLRVLQDRTYEPLGGTTTVNADVRVIAATHRDLVKQVKKGLFREDLFYRINVVGIDIPPLRNRKEDIPVLVDYFVARFNRLLGKQIMGVRNDVLDVLMKHMYPGNIRELENIIEHGFVLCSDGWIEPRHLPEQLAPILPEIRSHKTDFHSTLSAVEAQAIRDALKRNRYNRLSTARELGFHKSTLFRKMKALGIPFPKKDGRNKSENP